LCLDRVPRAGDTPSFTSDEEGLTFDNLDAAKREAATAAAEIGRDRPPKGDSREITVEARNEHCQWVLTVKVSLEADRVEPPPQPHTGEKFACELPIKAFLTSWKVIRPRRDLFRGCSRDPVSGGGSLGQAGPAPPPRQSAASFGLPALRPS